MRLLDTKTLSFLKDKNKSAVCILICFLVLENSICLCVALVVVRLFV